MDGQEGIRDEHGQNYGKVRDKIGVGTDDETGNKTTEIFRRELPKYRGIYVEGSLQGVDVVYTVDTGASCTIVSRNVFEQIPQENRPALCLPKLTHGLSSADGKILKFWGKADMDLVLGPLALKCHVSVADIEDEVLLGTDVLQQEGNTADILLSRGIMLLRGTAIPLKQVGPVSGVKKVTVGDDYVIPCLGEAVLDGQVERSEGDRGLMIVESEGMQGKSSEVIGGPSLVKVIALTKEIHNIRDIVEHGSDVLKQTLKEEGTLAGSEPVNPSNSGMKTGVVVTSEPYIRHDVVGGISDETAGAYVEDDHNQKCTEVVQSFLIDEHSNRNCDIVVMASSGPSVAEVGVVNVHPDTESVGSVGHDCEVLDSHSTHVAEGVVHTAQDGVARVTGLVCDVSPNHSSFAVQHTSSAFLNEASSAIDVDVVDKPMEFAVNALSAEQSMTMELTFHKMLNGLDVVVIDDKLQSNLEQGVPLDGDVHSVIEAHLPSTTESGLATTTVNTICITNIFSNIVIITTIIWIFSIGFSGTFISHFNATKNDATHGDKFSVFLAVYKDGERSPANGNRLLGYIMTELSTLNKMAKCQPNATDKLRDDIQRLENTLEDLNDHLYMIPVRAVSTAVGMKNPSTDYVVTSVQPPNIDRDVLNYECDQAWKRQQEDIKDFNTRMHEYLHNQSPIDRSWKRGYG